MSKTVSSDEQRWRAEDDARTLQSYAEINKDKSRRKAAEGVLRERRSEIDAVLGGTKKSTPRKSKKSWRP